MLTDQEKEQLVNELKNTKNEIAQLKNRLNAINKDKESWFQQKEEINRQIADRIGGVKDQKRLRNIFTSEVKFSKERRDSLNTQIKESIVQIKEYEAEYEKTRERLGIKESPHEMKRQIEKLEYAIQTEPMSFEKETALMKEIKRLRKKYDECKELNSVYKKMEERKKEISTLRKDATSLHNQIQKTAKESQGHHEVVLESMQEVNDLKAKEEEAYQKFFSLKKEFSEVNASLKGQLAKLRDTKDRLDKNNIALEEETREQVMKTLEEKEREVEEKIRKTKKLTTEDLLILQAQKDFGKEKDILKTVRRSRKKHAEEEKAEEAVPEEETAEKTPVKAEPAEPVVVVEGPGKKEKE